MEHPLFQRAFRDIQIMNGEISCVSSEFIPQEVEEEFEKTLMMEEQENYILYMCSKIFHFLQTFHGVTLHSMDTEWLQDDAGTLYIINCLNIKHTNQSRTYITTEMYFKRIQEQAEEKLKLRKGMEEKYTEPRKEIIS